LRPAGLADAPSLTAAYPAMSRTSSPQDRARLRALTPAAEDPSVKEGLVATPYGVATIRVRRLSVLFWVGGRGYVPTPVYEAEVRTPRTVREKQATATDGFVFVDGHVLIGGDGHPGLGRAPADFYEAFAEVERRLLRAVEARLAVERRQRGGAPERSAAQHGAADRPAAHPRRVARPVMPNAPGREEPADRPWATPPPVSPGAPGTRLCLVRLGTEGDEARRGGADV